jgi:hypothetical protein
MVISPDGLFPALYRESKEILMWEGGDSVVISSVITLGRNDAQNDYRVATEGKLRLIFFIYTQTSDLHNFLSYLLMTVIKRAPHEFKIACLEVIS